jgi:hypothetical protein
MSRLSLADLVDLEARLFAEQGETEEIRRTRYRALGRRLAEKGPLPDSSAGLLKALLQLDPTRDAPGKRFEAALRLLQAFLSLLGLLCGGSLSLSLLHYSGEHPINVLTVLAVLVGTQLVLLAILLFAMIPRRDSRTSGPVQHLLRAGLDWFLVRIGLAQHPLAIGDRLDAHRGLLRWILVRSAQIFGISFNLAALAGCFYRFAFSDVAFGWSTTLPLDASDVRRITDALATPWSWISHRGVPSSELVRMTQYSHLDGRYVLHGANSRSLGPALVGGWWAYILSCLMVYGLLPRLLTLEFAKFRVARILAETPTQNDAFARICEGMRAPLVDTRPDGADPAPLAVAPAPTAAEPALPPPGTACELFDGDPKLLGDRYGWTFGPGTDRPLVAVVSAWEEPTKGRLRRFADHRGRFVIVVLHDSSSKDDPRRAKIRDRWKRELPRVLDRVRVESL